MIFFNVFISEHIPVFFLLDSVFSSLYNVV